jgi:hypothetical protein
MAKVTFTFDTYEDADELAIYRQAPLMHGLLGDWTNHMRDLIKYQPDEMNHEILVFANRLYKEWWEMLSEVGIDPFS